MSRRCWIIGFIFLYTCCVPSLGWAGYTNSKLVTLVISATDQGIYSSGMGAGAEMRFSNDGVSWGAPESFATLRQNWDLTAYGGGVQDGLKTVYLKLKDSAGNWSTDQISASIILDQTAPATSATPPGGDYDKVQAVTLNANEAGNIYYTADGSLPTTSSPIYTAPIVLNQTTSLKFFAEDLAGNQNTVIAETYNIILDSDSDGMPDWWEEKYGLDPFVDDANQDNDQDGYTNLEEYLAGWNPTHYALTIYVDDDAPSGGDGTAEFPFNNIRQAIEQAIDADTILVLAGNYLESQALLMKERVDLIGAGYQCTIDLNGSGFIEGANYAAISGFKIINPLNNMGAISCSGTSPTIYNNLIIPSTNGAAGILLTNSSAAKIINNTILDAYIGIEIDSASPTIKNNIVADNTLGIMMYSGSPVIDYNNVWGNVGEESCPQGNYCGATPGVYDISADPRFVDQVVGDYHLQSDSPCIDTGAAADAPLDDIDGDLRPQGAGYDIGADEFVAKLLTIALNLNKSSFTTGERIIVSVDITAPELPTVVDLYISFQLPNGTIYYYPYWSTFSTPLLRSWEVVDLSTIFYDYTFEGHESAGEYTWEAHFVEPGTGNVIGQPTSVSFTLSP